MALTEKGNLEIQLPPRISPSRNNHILLQERPRKPERRATDLAAEQPADDPGAPRPELGDLQDVGLGRHVVAAAVELEVGPDAVAARVDCEGDVFLAHLLGLGLLWWCCGV